MVTKFFTTQFESSMPVSLTPVPVPVWLRTARAQFESTPPNAVPPEIAGLSPSSVRPSIETSLASTRMSLPVDVSLVAG